MMLRTLSRRVTITALVAACCAPAFAQTENYSVTLDYARKELEAGKATVIDIREPEEHATGVAKGAVLLPLRQLAARMGEIPKDSKKPVLLICNTQNRSSAAFATLFDKGYTHVRFVQGGMSEWNRRGWPVVKP